jgi:hypothetical protein
MCALMTKLSINTQDAASPFWANFQGRWAQERLFSSVMSFSFGVKVKIKIFRLLLLLHRRGKSVSHGWCLMLLFRVGRGRRKNDRRRFSEV